MTEPQRSVQQLFDLSGRAALITGATGHLGQAMAAALAEAGARVIVASRKENNAQAAAARLGGAQSGRHLAVTIDHLDEESIERGFASAVEQAGQIDILVNNGHEGLAADWSNVSGEQFNRQLANATGYFLLSRALRNHAVARQAPASILLLGSMYGFVGSYPDVYDGVSAASPAAYHALKGGIVHLTRHLAVYWAVDRVRVNCLSPGPFPSATANSELIERLTQRSPLGRIGSPEELKGAVVFLASDASSYMTGQNLVIDGGWTAW
jgi:NAD(P)-dependent dehydrogenase (short-subunit alcohol dehydrogenase family)